MKRIILLSLFLLLSAGLHPTYGQKTNKLQAAGIDTYAISSGPYCAGSELIISYSVSTSFLSGNIFTAQLSDSQGYFSNPTSIGSVSSVGAGTITASIPLELVTGSNYRIRVVSSSPEIIGSEYPSAVSMYSLPDVSIEGDTETCINSVATYSAESGSGQSYQWHSYGGIIQGSLSESSVDVLWTESEGRLTLDIENENTGCTNSAEIYILVNEKPTPTISGYDVVCAYSNQTYTSTYNYGAKNYWDVVGGRITSNKTGQVINVEWNDQPNGKVILYQTLTATGCMDSTVFDVEINPIPAPDIIGDFNVCPDEVLTYSTESTDTKNQWIVSGGTILERDNETCTVQWTGTGVSFIQIISTDEDNGCIGNKYYSVSIYNNPTPVISGPEKGCTNCPLVYTSNSPVGVSDQWYVFGGEILGSSTDKEVLIQWGTGTEGTVKVIQTTDATGCTDSTTMLVDIVESPELSINGANSTCAEATEEYTAPVYEGDVTYSWKVSSGEILTDSDNNKITVKWGDSRSGNVKLIVEKPSISFIDSVDMQVNLTALPAKPTITVQGDFLISSAEEGNQWFVNGNLILNADKKIYQPSISGYYTVQVTGSSGCVSHMSDETNFIVGVEDNIATELFTVYPNPMNEQLNISFNKEDIMNIDIKIIDMLGNTVLSYHPKDSFTQKITLSTVDIAKGAYVIQINADGNIYHTKLIKE